MVIRNITNKLNQTVKQLSSHIMKFSRGVVENKMTKMTSSVSYLLIMAFLLFFPQPGGREEALSSMYQCTVVAEKRKKDVIINQIPCYQEINTVPVLGIQKKYFYQDDEKSSSCNF